MESSTDEEKSDKKKVDYTGLGYCCCFVFILLLILSILFWYITFPIIGVLTIVYLILRQFKKKKLYITLDTRIKQDDFIRETGYLPIEKEKFTEKYKTWLLQKENEKKTLLQLHTTLQTQPSSQPTAISQPEPRQDRETEKDKIIHALTKLHTNILELPRKYPTSGFSHGAGLAQAKEQIPIICSNIKDAINALKKGYDSNNRPITQNQIADGLVNLINATRSYEFIALTTNVLNSDGINELKQKMNKLEQQAIKIRSYKPESISQTHPISSSKNIVQTKFVPRLQTPSQPVYNQEKIIENIAKVDSKQLKAKFRDYTRGEKTLLLIMESVALFLLIFFCLFIVWSIINQLYLNIVISTIILFTYFIPHEILERKLRKRVQIRKQKEIIMKYIDFAKVASSPPSQSEPSFPTELTYIPASKKDTKKIICNYCGSENKETSKYCEKCGGKLD